MSRLRAFLVHLTLSATIVGSVFAIVFFVWYPEPYFDIVGAWYLVRILLVVDVILGPLLTLIIFKSGKPGLRFDLTVIALVQLAALSYGTTIIYQERPFYLVFAVDRFELVPRKDIDTTQIKFDALKDKPWIGAVPVYARLPDDPDEFSHFMDETIFEGKPDLERRPEYWHPYAEFAQEAGQKSKDLDEFLSKYEDKAEAAARAVEKLKPEHGNLGYAPLIGRTSTFMMLMDRETGEPLEVVYVDPYGLISDGTGKAAAAS